MANHKLGTIANPFRPGAGHMPPYLAGREDETNDFLRLLEQETVLENPILTGLRGLGKTVLLEKIKPMAIDAGWLWAGTDLSESTSISEENLAIRLLTDLSVVTSQIVVGIDERPKLGFTHDADHAPITLDYRNLRSIFDHTPGLIIDKLKAVLETVAPYLSGKKGLIFAYDEAQNLADHAEKEQYPLSLLLDLFMSIQRKGIRFMLALTGLPTLFQKLVEARTFSERMFHLIVLAPLNREETSEAISRPIAQCNCPVNFVPASIETIWKITKGYPYFIQFVCREIFDVWAQHLHAGKAPAAIPVDAILRKLDVDFFAGRWSRATDRQRDLLLVIAYLPGHDGEFSVQDIVESDTNINLEKSFSASHVNQMLAALADAGLVYKNRHGRYSLAVPLLGHFIRRAMPSPPGASGINADREP
jgi:hypothetical protein